MGRKSKADERREAILAAFERCIARYGIDASLEQIALEAGVQRSIIRHYLGNRDAVVEQVIARIAEAYPPRIATALAEAAAYGVPGLLDALFSEDPDINAWDEVILAVVNTAQERYPQAKLRLAAMLEQIVAIIAAQLAQLFPDADATLREHVAYGLLCVLQTHESMMLLGLSRRYTAAARASAALLLRELAPTAAA